jgi:aerobic carbon-monoxide dehydrogenase medium subunit
VKPAPFDYYRPTSAREAAETLAATGGKALAGGQSLIPLLSMRLAAPGALVDINFIPGLGDIDVDTDGVRVGALVRHRHLEEHEAAYAANPLLRRAVSQVAHPTIRNRGTTVGSLVHADPAAEMPAVLCLTGGAVHAIGADGRERDIPADEFFVGPLECALASDEIAVAATFDAPAPDTGSSWVELARRQGDYALVGVGAVVRTDGGVVRQARVALISVGLTPVVVDVTDACVESPYDRVDWTEAGNLISAAIEPEGDIHATAEYRSHLANVLSARALQRALEDGLRMQEAA